MWGSAPHAPQPGAVPCRHTPWQEVFWLRCDCAERALPLAVRAGEGAQSAAGQNWNQAGVGPEVELNWD
jgi:hypothetical protein